MLMLYCVSTMFSMPIYNHPNIIYQLRLRMPLLDLDCTMFEADHSNYFVAEILLCEASTGK